MVDQCPPDREWLEWATDRWIDMDPDDPRAKELLQEIFRENGRRWLRRDPRRLRRRDVLRRRDPETLRTMIWLRNRKMLRARGVGLRSVPASRQVAAAVAPAATRTDSYDDSLQTWAAKVQAKDVFWLRTQCDLHAIAQWLSPEARAALQEPPTSDLPDYVNDRWREAAPQADLFGTDGVPGTVTLATGEVLREGEDYASGVTAMPITHLGESNFEGWFAQYDSAGKGDKQRARDAYAAGLGEQATHLGVPLGGGGQLKGGA